MEGQYEAPVRLDDDSYYFWHPGTETFLGKSTGLKSKIIGTPMAVNLWAAFLRSTTRARTAAAPCGAKKCRAVGGG